ncbi:MAG: isoprenylcysteine carboxylmethyltransferase family protein [Chloroflexia bacterium]
MKALNRVHGRIARPASVRRNLTKTLVQSQSMWLVFFFLIPAYLYYSEGHAGLKRYRFTSAGWRSRGVTLFMLGWILAYISAAFMVVHGEGTPLPADATRKLVIVGPYRYVRNPMAIGSFAQGFAVAFFLGSPAVTLYVLVGSVGWNYFVRPWEESDLEWRFGAAYAHYRDHVRCWIPNLRAYTSKQPPLTT